MMLLVILFGGAFAVYGQTSNAPEPDYSNVSDILDGRRTLLTINDVVIGGLVLKTSDGTKIDLKDIYQLPGYNPKDAGPETLARLFDSANDTVVYTSGQTIDAIDPVSQKTTSLRLDVPTNEFDEAAIGTGDFRGDGFSEVVIASASGVRIVGPNDPNDFSKGLMVGPAWKPDGYRGSNSNLALAVGDFLGDGQHEVAFTWGNTDLNRTFLDVLTVDPKTFAVESKSQSLLIFHGPTYRIGVSLTTGRFGSTSHDQLAAALYAYSAGDPQQRLRIRSYDFNDSLQLSLKEEVRTDLKAGGEVVVKTGRFNPISPYQQAAIKYDMGANNVQLGIVSLDNTLKIRPPQWIVAPVGCSTPGLAVGNFSRTEPVPQDPNKLRLSLKLQLAIETDNCRGGAMGLNIFNVEPPPTPDGNFTVIRDQAFTRTTDDPTWLQYLNTPIVAGDIQGRSYVLGPPSKVVISESAQPSVIVASPPMHVDYIAPVQGDGPEVLNLSAIPDGFYTTYETTSSEEYESSTTNTTSWGFGAMERLEASLELGSIENGFGTKNSVAFSAAQNLKQVVETEHSNYQSKDFSLRLQTKFSDHVWFSENRFNIYVYPVIGKTVCPAAKPNCAASDQIPLTLQFSAPDETKYRDLDADLIPWYQPPWEPGNVLSYPATYALLQGSIPNPLQKLSVDSTWSTDGSVRQEQTSWTQQATNGSSASFDQSYSFETEFSVAGACCGRFVNGSLSAQLNLSGSTGFSDLNKAVATIGKSTGIGINKPGTFLTPVIYNYEVTPYIFGEQPPASKGDNTPSQSDVQTSGMLRTAFAADPLATFSGAWWKQAYSGAPDVALNHPVRWDIVSQGLENPIPSNCRQSGTGSSTMDCASLQPSFPDNPFVSPFHIMRGFFITSAANPGKGPQLSTAKAGDQLTLQARVYNYSLVPMPDGSQVHVRFYAQPWNKDTHTAIGDSVLVNNADVVLNPIPPFNDDPGAQLNWTLASTTFDTTPYANQYLTFWVVVWIEDSSGKLVPELSGHGLTAVPGTLKSIADLKNGTEEYSNNVGFYNSEFYVFPSEPALNEGSLDGEP
ncbi:MAG: hypothetical protein JO182_05365 [Acidobacteriaceae bacterium]|nr:hypothetical protein [Acidobacteriaceae bacterium]